VAENTPGMISAAFVKAVHVELAYEGIHFAVAKVLGEHDLLKLGGVFDHEFFAGRRPEHNFAKLLVLANNQSTFRISKVLAMKPATSAL